MWTFSQCDSQHNPHQNTHKEKERRRPKTKDQTQVWNEGTSWSAWWLDDETYTAKTESAHTDSPQTRCLVSSPSGTAMIQSCCGTPSGPRLLLPHQRLGLSWSTWASKEAWPRPYRTSSAGPWSTCLGAWTSLLGFAWFATRGRKSILPSCSSQIPCS